MYWCYECEKEFDDTKHYAGDSGEYWGAPYTQYYEGCPYCKSEYIYEIRYQCECCNRNIVEGDVYYELPDGSTFCEECITKREA